MRFFTPDLYIRFNSAEDDEADRADEAWEAAIADYRRHLDDLRDQMPSHVWKLTELCLHDAELLSVEESLEPLLPQSEAMGAFPYCSAVAVVSMKQHGAIHSLIYVLWDRMRDRMQESWPFSTQRVHWLYDEIDIATTGRGTFLHRILFSNGRSIEIPFVSAMIHALPAEAADVPCTPRQTA